MRAPAMNIQNWKSPTTERTLTSESLQLTPSKAKRPPHKRSSKPRGCGQVRPRASSQATGDDRLVLPSSCFVQTALDLVAQLAQRADRNELSVSPSGAPVSPLSLTFLSVTPRRGEHLEDVAGVLLGPHGSAPQRQWPAAAVGRKTSGGRAWQVKSVEVTSGQDMEDQDKSGQVRTGHVT